MNLTTVIEQNPLSGGASGNVQVHPYRAMVTRTGACLLRFISHIQLAFLRSAEVPHSKRRELPISSVCNEHVSNLEVPVHQVMLVT